ncbi:MAG: hypothetical protein ABI651_12120 [Verrucomicrobiota bacterium]
MLREDGVLSISAETDKYYGSHTDLQFHMEVTPETILGRKATGVGAVALAMQSSAGWTLIDGVDLIS